MVLPPQAEELAGSIAHHAGDCFDPVLDLGNRPPAQARTELHRSLSGFVDPLISRAEGSRHRQWARRQRRSDRH